jgi:hypothetical protein
VRSWPIVHRTAGGTAAGTAVVWREHRAETINHTEIIYYFK